MQTRAQARGWNSVEVPAPQGREIPRIHSNLSPLWGWDPGLLFTLGLRPGLHSYAAPRLKPQRAQFIHSFYERRYSRWNLLTPGAPVPGRTIEGQEPAAKDNSHPAEQ